MALLLCSRIDSVREKWVTSLHQRWEVHQAASLAEIFSDLKSSRFDLVLLHREMVDDGQLGEVCQAAAGSKVFVFADRPDDNEGIACLRIGCVGYANTYIATKRMEAAIEAVESGLVWVGSSLMQRLIQGLGNITAEGETEEESTPQTASKLSPLSKREYQIATLVAAGMSNGEIAVELDITERTVKAHLSSIYSKTHTKGRLNLALLMKSEGK